MVDGGDGGELCKLCESQHGRVAVGIHDHAKEVKIEELDSTESTETNQYCGRNTVDNSLDTDEKEIEELDLTEAIDIDQRGGFRIPRSLTNANKNVIEELDLTEVTETGPYGAAASSLLQHGSVSQRQAGRDAGYVSASAPAVFSDGKDLGRSSIRALIQQSDDEQRAGVGGVTTDNPCQTRAAAKMTIELPIRTPPTPSEAQKTRRETSARTPRGKVTKRVRFATPAYRVREAPSTPPPAFRYPKTVRIEDGELRER